MKTKRNNFTRASALQITFSIALIFVFASLLTSAAVATPILGNYPDTSLALSTDTAVTPDAAPTNTTSINVSTSTDFKGTLTGDPMTGVVRVTDAHPAGPYTVTVTAFDSGGETASKTFTLTVTTPVACLSLSFATPTIYSAGVYPKSVAVGDFNGDGKQDVAVANFDSDTVSILLGDGAGNFSAPTNFTVGNYPYAVAVGDFNGDGKQDLAVTNYANFGSVSILFGDGAGNFSAPTNFGVGVVPTQDIAVGDFNGDGKQDLVVSGVNDGVNVSILWGDGGGNFGAPQSVGYGDKCGTTVAVGDFNGDGKQDIAAAYTPCYPPDDTGEVRIFYGDGAGNFSQDFYDVEGYGHNHSVAVGDFNGDGKQDIVIPYSVSGGFGGLSIIFNNGDVTELELGSGPNFVAVGDFNGDGKQDLAVAGIGYPTPNVSILLGDGTGHFTDPINLGAGSGSSVAVGDFNGDSKQDLAIANYASDSVSILLGDCLVSQITTAGTTCSQISSGTAESLGSLQYDITNDLIERIRPRNFLYWVAVTAPAGDNSVGITQAITTDNFNTFFEGSGFGSKVYDSNCVSLPRTGRDGGNTATVRFNAPAAGTYYIGINFIAQSLLDQPAPSPTTVHYDFTTTGVSDSTSGLDLLEH